jgi:hypothetical protein
VLVVINEAFRPNDIIGSEINIPHADGKIGIRLLATDFSSKYGASSAVRPPLNRNAHFRVPE